MARIRSPNYPAISLPEAIARIQTIHAKAHTHKVDAETMAKAAGYAGINGAALSMLSALKKYGLVDEVGKDLRISPMAITIIADPPNSPARRDAVQSAAFAPTLFSDLRKEFPGQIPGDDIVRSYLVKKSFAANALDAAITAFQGTMRLVTVEGLGYSTQANTLNADEMLEELRSQPNATVLSQSEVAGIAGGSPKSAISAAHEIGTYPVAANCKIRLTATGPYDKTSIEALVKQLQLALDLEIFPDRTIGPAQEENQALPIKVLKG